MTAGRPRPPARSKIGARSRLIGLLCCVTACEGPGPDVDAESPREEARLYFENGISLWNNGLGTGAVINICFAVRPWIMPNGTTRCPSMTSANKDCQGVAISSLTLRSVVRHAWEDTWMRAGNIELVNWGDCPIEPGTNKHRATSMGNTVGVTFASELWPPELGIDRVNNDGRHSDQVTFLQLNQTAMNAGTNNFNLVHEFGHALGFTHEWRRTDWNQPICNSEGMAAGTLLTFPDRDSIMNYDCGGRPNVVTLYPGDIMGMQKAYGRKPTGSLVGYRGMCADISGGSTANGAPIITYPCRNAWNDKFFRSTTSTFELFRTNSNNKCLNVSGGTAPNPIISWDCGDFENERFTTVGVEWRGMGNMCVQASGGGLVIKKCDGTTAAQKWDFAHPVGGLRRDQIRSSNTNNCVSSVSTTGALGQALVLSPCSATDTRQRFLMPGNGRVTLANNSAFCANVSGGLPTPDKPVILWDGCTSSPPQNSQFTLRGKVRSLNHCMSTEFANPGEAIRATSCTSNDVFSQSWEYYF